MHSVEAINLIHFATSITQDCSHYSFIANSKTFSIYISISCSWTFSGTICNFESYGASVGFGFDNSKAFGGGCFNSFEDGVISYDFNIIAIGV